MAQGNIGGTALVFWLKHLLYGTGLGEEFLKLKLEKVKASLQERRTSAPPKFMHGELVALELCWELSRGIDNCDRY